MHPYIVRIGDLAIQAYPLIYGVGIAVAGSVILLLGARQGLDTRRLAHSLMLVSLALVVGGRMFYVLQHGEQFAHEPGVTLNLSRGGHVLYGGLLLGVPALIISTRQLGLPMGRTADLFAVGAPLGLAVGRWACFCRGCCCGRMADLPWSMRYPKHVSLDGDAAGPPAFLSHLDQGLLTEAAEFSLPVHPAPVYASLVSLSIFVIMFWLWKNGRFSGRLIIAYCIIYAMSRFVLEFTRENEMAFWGLTIPQVVSVVVVAAGTIVLAALRTKVVAVRGPLSSRRGPGKLRRRRGRRRE